MASLQISEHLAFETQSVRTMLSSLRAFRLDNELAEEKLRQERARADIVENARDRMLGIDEGGEPDQESEEEGALRRREGGAFRSADSLTEDDFAVLLDPPMNRLLEYGGGEIEIAEVEDDASADGE